MTGRTILGPDVPTVAVCHVEDGEHLLGQHVLELRTIHDAPDPDPWESFWSMPMYPKNMAFCRTFATPWYFLVRSAS